MRLIIRHILPVGLSTSVLFGLWMMAMAPWFGVFLIDDDPPALWEFAMSFALLFGISFGVIIVVLFPIAALGETLSRRTKHAIWAMPVGLGMASVSILIGQAVVLDSLLDAVLNWGGLMVLLSGLFMLYWVALWLEKVAILALVCTRVFWRK